MSYSTDFGNIGVIDDSNAQLYVEENKVLSGAFGSGMVKRDYALHGLGSYANVFSGEIIPRSKWDDLIKRQDDNESSPYHHHIASDVEVLDQNGYPYCWMYGTVAGVMNRYASQGLPVPFLSATAPAAQGKDYKQEGGWAAEAIPYIEKYGLPTVDTWPQHSLDRKLAKNHEQQLDAARHGIVQFEELPQSNFDAAASCLLDPYNPSPVTLGLMWWGHLVCGLRLVKVDRNTYGILIVNSWTREWGENGFKVLVESKATAHECVAIRNVKVRAE